VLLLEPADCYGSDWASVSGDVLTAAAAAAAGAAAGSSGAGTSPEAPGSSSHLQQLLAGCRQYKHPDYAGMTKQYIVDLSPKVGPRWPVAAAPASDRMLKAATRSSSSSSSGSRWTVAAAPATVRRLKAATCSSSSSSSSYLLPTCLLSLCPAGAVQGRDSGGCPGGGTGGPLPGTEAAAGQVRVGGTPQPSFHTTPQA
jgi:hypothetical protein